MGEDGHLEQASELRSLEPGHTASLPLLLGDDEHVVKEKEVDLLFGHPF